MWESATPSPGGVRSPTLKKKSTKSKNFTNVSGTDAFVMVYSRAFGLDQ